MKNVKDFDVRGKNVLVRCDFNVPTDDKGNISDDFRIKKTLPTIQYLIQNKAKVILISHLGEPDGKIVPMLTLDKVREKLQDLLGTPVIKTDDCVGDEVEKIALALLPGQILLLENVRFHKGEMENSVAFARKLSKLGEIYINDAFGDCHRDHASITSLAMLLPSGAGLLLEEEINGLKKILENPKKPLVAVIGGLKVETKQKFISNILQLADTVIINGLLKNELQEKKIQFKSPEKIVGPEEDLLAKDIDDSTIAVFKEIILSAKTVVWNGPFGHFEDGQNEKGTLEIAKAIIESRAYSVVGGGETIEFLNKEGMIKKFNHVSTGGGAMLAYLAGEELPGLKALEYENQD